MIRLAHQSLREMGIENPKIAVPGLNPHSGDDGLFGDEEEKIITPAIDAARAEGIIVEGPVPPDSVFIKARGGKYDIVVALYHDQGHIPGKFLGWEWNESSQRYTAMQGVTIVLGLPIIRTNPDHGTALADCRGRNRKFRCHGGCCSSSPSRCIRGGDPSEPSLMTNQASVAVTTLAV